MAGTTETLDVQTRPAHGSTSARALRHTGKIPGVLYGHGKDAVPVTIDARAIEDFLHGGKRHNLLPITIDGGSADTVLVREVQRDPISRRILHADLLRVGRSEAITTTIPIVAVGVPAGVRDGGILDVVAHEIEVTGPADKIPEHLEVDVSGIAIREHVTAADVKMPPGFKLATSPETVVASVEPPKTHDEAAPAAAEVPTVAETQAPEGAT